MASIQKPAGELWSGGLRLHLSLQKKGRGGGGCLHEAQLQEQYIVCKSTGSPSSTYLLAA
jgi:hypothetical protein